MSDAQELVEALRREASWYERHPRAHMDDHGMCSITPEEANDTATLMRKAADMLEYEHSRHAARC
jgi:hypothetical protein